MNSNFPSPLSQYLPHLGQISPAPPPTIIPPHPSLTFSPPAHSSFVGRYDAVRLSVVQQRKKMFAPLKQEVFLVSTICLEFMSLVKCTTTHATSLENREERQR